MLSLLWPLLAAAGTLHGQEVREWAHHGGSLQAARFARAADRLVTSGSLPGRIVVWDTNSWQPIRVWKGLAERPGVLIDDSGRLVLAYTARHLQAFVVDGDTVPITIELPADRQVTGIALSPDGQRAFILAGKRVEGETMWSATSYSTRSGERENETTVAGRPLQAALSSDSQQLVVLTRMQGLLLSCRTFRARSLPELSSHDALAERFDGLQLAVRKGLEVRKFNTVTGAFTPLAQMDPPEQGPAVGLRPYISPDGRFLACPLDPGERLVVRDLGDSPRQRTVVLRTALPFYSFPVRMLDLKWSRDGKRIFTVHFNGSVLACDPEDGSVSEIFSCCASGGKVDRVWMLAGRLAASSSGSDLVVVDPESSRVLWHRPGQDSPTALGICKDEAWVCARGKGAGGEIMIHDSTTGRLLEQRPMEHRPAALEMSPDGRVVAMVKDWDSQRPFVSTDIEIWSRPERKPLCSLSTTAIPHSLAFSRDSRWLAVGCGQRKKDWRHSLLLIDTREGRIRTELTLPAEARGFGRAVFVSDDVLASYDDRDTANHRRLLRLWNPMKAELLEEIPVYNSRLVVPQHGGRYALLGGRKPFEPTEQPTSPGGLQLIDLKTRNALWRGADHLEPTAAAWTADDRKALIGFVDGGLGVLEIKEPPPRADSTRE